MLESKHPLLQYMVTQEGLRWLSSIKSSSKLRTYSLVKKSLCVEPYILNINRRAAGSHLDPYLRSLRLRM